MFWNGTQSPFEDGRRYYKISFSYKKIEIMKYIQSKYFYKYMRRFFKINYNYYTCPPLVTQTGLRFPCPGRLWTSQMHLNSNIFLLHYTSCIGFLEFTRLVPNLNDVLELFYRCRICGDATAFVDQQSFLEHLKEKHNNVLFPHHKPREKVFLRNGNFENISNAEVGIANK